MARASRTVRERRAGYEAPTTRRLLLDTHAWLWWYAGDARLGPAARRFITDAAEVRFSAASVWEIAIKSALGKLTMPRNLVIAAELQQDAFDPLAVDVSHAEAVRWLPPHHRDPFDRLLIAQAQLEGLAIVTADPQFSRYEVGLLAADL